MKKNVIKINGKTYPCRLTMGAALRFKEDTGKEVSETIGISDACRLLYHCAQSACNRDKVAFDMSLEDFADSLDVKDVMQWINSISEVVTGEVAEVEEEKKS